MNKPALTARSWYDEHLRVNEHLIHAALSVWHIPTDEIVTNPAWAELLGREPDTDRPIAVADWYDRFHPADVPNHLAELEKLFEQPGYRYACDWRLRRDDGIWIWIHGVQRVVERDADGSPLIVCATHTDVNEPKLAADRLSRERLEFAAVLSGTGAGLWEIDVLTEEIWVSEQWCELLGLDPSENHLPMSAVVAMVHPDDAERVEAMSALRAENTAEHSQSEYRLRRSDGTWLWVQARRRPYRRQPDGTVISVIGFHIDIDDRVRAEATLQQSLRVETAGRLAGGIAHDFNNALGVILGNAELLLRSDEPDIDKHAAAIISTANRASRLTKRLLGFSEKATMQLSHVNLNQLLRGTQELCESALPSSVELTVALAARYLAVMVDRETFEDAMLTLVLNAVDAQATRITIETGGPIDGATDAGLGLIAVTVTDDGIGMNAETTRKATEPFFTTKPIGEGSGLGLAMVRRAVDHINGRLTIDSVVGGGTSVSIELPIVGEATSPDGPPSDPPPAQASDRIAVVVDDEPNLRDIAATFLRRAGITVIEATEGEEALEALAAEPRISLLFSDVVMPNGMGGIELADLVRARHPSVAILLTSGYSADPTLGHPLLQKPYREQDLLEALASLPDMSDA